jgi:glycosyltransferase involved in cell wall biosynthesis
MRIAFDHQTFTQQRYGGISRYYAKLAENLLHLDQCVGIFAPLYCNAYLPLLSKGTVHGYDFGNYPEKTNRIFQLVNGILARRQIKRWKPSILHETFYSDKSIDCGASAKVITVFDMIYELFKHDYNGSTYKPDIKKMAIERADHIICISNNTKLDLMRLLGVPESKISVVLLGFDHFQNAYEKSKIVQWEDKPYLLYVGNRDKYKNFSAMLKEVASSSKLLNDFDIIAFGGPKFTKSEWLYSKSLGFGDNQIKHVSGDDIALRDVYQSATAFIFPSLYEGFGIPPLEAMANNCPVVSSNTSSMPEVIGNAAEYFDPYVKGSMLQAIERVVYSNARTSVLKTLGHKRLPHFSWEKCAKETLQIYKKLV